MQETQLQFLGWEDPPGEGNGNLLQYSSLENPMDCSLPGSSVYGVARVGHDLVTKLPLRLPALPDIYDRACILWANPFRDAMWLYRAFPGGARGKEPTCQCRRPGFDPCVRNIPWRRAWQPTFQNLRIYILSLCTLSFIKASLLCSLKYPKLLKQYFTQSR